MMSPQTPYASGGGYFLSRRAVDSYLQTYPSLLKYLIYEDGMMGKCLNASPISHNIIVQKFPKQEYLKAFYWDDD